MNSRAGGWTFFLCGTKKIIHAASEEMDWYQNESTILLDWIYYRDWAKSKDINKFCRGVVARGLETGRAAASAVSRCLARRCSKL